MEPVEPVFKILDEYIDKFNNAPFSQTGIFKNPRDKEHYETIFMYSFRKYRAAVYHYNHVSKFLKDHEEFAQTTSSRDIGKDGAYTVNLSYTADHYAFELSAFLESLKSSIDFLASSCSFHLPGIKCRSISTLMKLVKDEDKRGPIFDEVRENLEWLEGLRTYRHHFVHYRMNSTSCGYERQVINGVQKIIIYPVIIPESPPPYIPDTRENRAVEKSPFLKYSGGYIKIKNDNGGDNSLLKFYPPPGYVAIEDFMELYLNLYEKFFTELIHALSDLDFKNSPLSK
jgi:hypothetical protein